MKEAYIWTAQRPSRLYVKRVSDAVFVVTVSSERVAAALAIIGSLRLADVLLFFHPSLESATRAASRLPPLGDAAGQLAQKGNPAVKAHGGCPTTGFIATSNPSPPAPEAIRLGSVPADLLSVLPGSLLSLPGSGGAARRLVAPAVAASDVPLPSVFNVHQRPKSYVDAARSPPAPTRQVFKTLKPLALSRACYRCLATDHLVDACREPVRCRRCRASGHRSPQCKMKLCVLLRAAAKRMRSPSLPKDSQGRLASPSADARLPPALLEDEPPSDFHPPPPPPPPPSAAFLPINMVASSSSAPPPVEALSSQRMTEDPCVDKFVLPSPCSPCLQPTGTSRQVSSAGPSVMPALTPAVTDSLEPGVEGVVSSTEEYVSGELELDSVSSASGSSWHEGRPRHADAWVSPGGAEPSQRLLFAFIEPPVPAHEVSAFIRNALRTVAPLQPVDLLQSSLGAMILRCESPEARDSLHLLGPISLGGSLMHLLKPEDTTNRFFRVPVWLAFVHVDWFPIEHWYTEKIKECFSSFAEVAEIDPECLSGDNYGPLRLLLEVNDRLNIARELCISCKQGVGRSGAVARITPIRVWPREFQLDCRGNLAPFFGPPAPPSSGPSLGPSGPLISAQQLRPQSHYYSLAFPTANAGRFASNLQRPFDPIGTSAPSGSHLPLLLPHQALALAFSLARVLDAPPTMASSGPGAPPTNVLLGSEEAAPTATAPANTLTLSAPRSASGRGGAKPVITYQRRRFRSKTSVLAAPAPPRAGRKPSVANSAVRRSSSRLAAKAAGASGKFVDTATQAIQRKELLNSLSTCSVSLKKHVAKRNILSRNLLPMSATDLRALVAAAKLGPRSSGDVVDGGNDMVAEAAE